MKNNVYQYLLTAGILLTLIVVYNSQGNADDQTVPVVSSPEDILPAPTAFPTSSTTTTTVTSSTYTTTTTTTTISTSTTVPIVCEYSQLDLFSRVRRYGKPADFDYVAGNVAVPSCILSALLETHALCLGSVEFSKVDDCIAWKIFGFPTSPNGYPPRYSWNGSIANTSNVLYIRQDSSGSCSVVNVDSIPQEELCYGGRFTWYASPISLLWDNEVNIEHDLRFTTFPLDLSIGTTWNVWKASAKAPLLVYDPDHLGKITSASQLFGNWTFGGKKLEQLSQSSKYTKVPWQDGYQALASLDNDGDGKISDTELLPLGLWFDENRDGISQPGEVKTISEVGVTTLYFHPNREEPGTKSLYADKGYEIIRDGQTFIGRSVDWKSDTAASKTELINRLLATGLGCMNRTASSKDHADKYEYSPMDKCNNIQLTPSSNKHSQRNTDLSGLWIWKSESTKGNPEGILGFKDTMDGLVQGHTYSAFHINNKTSNFSDIFSANHFYGSKFEDQGGTFKLIFTVKPDETSVLENEAIFDPNEQKLFGKTLAKLAIGTTPVDLSYSWIATRIPVK